MKLTAVLNKIALFSVLMLTLEAFSQEPADTPAASPEKPSVTPEKPSTDTPKSQDDIRKGQKPGRKPLVVMKQADIFGKVFLIESEENAQNSAAKRIMIKVTKRDNDQDIYETGTDDEGTFKIPNLDKGEYNLIVGLLNLELNVLEPDPQASGKLNIPKNIVVFIPNAMFKKASKKFDPKEKATPKP